MTREYYLANKEKVKAANQARLARLDPSELSARRKKWRARAKPVTPEQRAQRNEKAKSRYHTDAVRRESVKATSKLTYLRHPERVKARAAVWDKANPECRRGIKQRRRARDANPEVTTEQIAALLAGAKCAACGSADRIEIDHILPLALGGRSVIENLQPLCCPCNRSKGAKHPDDWLGRASKL